MDKIAEEQREITSRLLAAHRDGRHFLVALHARHAVGDGWTRITLQNSGNALFVDRHASRRFRELFLDYLSYLGHANRFHKDCIRLEEDGSHGLLKGWVAGEQQRNSIGLCMAHGADDGKSISSIRHLQVGEKHVEVFGRNKFQRFVYGGGGDHFEPLAFQDFLERGAGGVVGLHEKDSIFLLYVLV